MWIVYTGRSSRSCFPASQRLRAADCAQQRSRRQRQWNGADGPGARPGLHHPQRLPVRLLENYKATPLQSPQVPWEERRKERRSRAQHRTVHGAAVSEGVDVQPELTQRWLFSNWPTRQDQLASQLSFQTCRSTVFLLLCGRKVFQQHMLCYLVLYSLENNKIDSFPTDWAQDSINKLA